ncbi:MAG TPA: hypothetical protein VGQ65_10460 [Thermoanaerobaculia bacterium]|jgi:hypothetical protein|nr:hypothetical protein [Thermoanaerobaculia bacterium]
MSERRQLHRYTYADYVALEMISTRKHEFLDGEIYAMAGGSEEQSAWPPQWFTRSGTAWVIVPAASTHPTCASTLKKLGLRHSPTLQ